MLSRTLSVVERIADRSDEPHGQTFLGLSPEAEV
jgi:hypothetical protein